MYHFEKYIYDQFNQNMDDKNYVIHEFHSLNVTGCRKVSVAISGSSCEQILRFKKKIEKVISYYPTNMIKTINVFIK